LRARLMADPATKGYLIQVETFHGTVLLSGYVELATVRMRALQLAREISGTDDVTDSLECRET
jgi:hyperosmotically inducible periplasmic protein